MELCGAGNTEFLTFKHITRESQLLLQLPSQRVDRGPTVSASPGSLLETQNLWFHPRPTKNLNLRSSLADSHAQFWKLISRRN